MASRTKNILVIEDNRAVASMLYFILTEEGYDVTLAYDAHEAAELIREELPDLILSDIMLPETNGLVFAQALLKKHNIPIIFLTALGGRENRHAGLAAGAIDYITKPFDPGDLVKRIKTAIEAVH